jgi:hypothetical protein
MTCTLHVAWDDRLSDFDFGPSHPMAPLPETMTEGGHGQFTDFEAGHDQADPVDQAIMATRKAVFPLQGLVP